MPETQEIVINTGPMIAIVAALGGLDVLKIYRRVCVPLEVCGEITTGEFDSLRCAGVRSRSLAGKMEAAPVPVGDAVTASCIKV